MNDMKLIGEIRNYYMNPKNYPNENRSVVEQAISLIDCFLQKKDDNGKELFLCLCNEYTTDSSNAPINTLIRQSRADEEGISATRGYKEIYFNEIVQNANDNTNDNYLDITIENTNDEYSLIFSYADKGFTVENIIGLFNSEIHTKRKNLAATGKHGVGIKALFYFVDSLEIHSNIIARFQIETVEEDGQEKIKSVRSELLQNNNWDGKTTHLTISYKKKDDYGEFNVKKLNTLIDLISYKRNMNQEITYNDIEKFFWNTNQSELVFDCRALLFTDKNKCKRNGIKKITFWFDGQQSFVLSALPDNTISISEEGFTYSVEKCSLLYNGSIKLNYLVVTVEDEKEGEQNFSMAFPEVDRIKKSSLRFYETYYIPETQLNSEENFNFPFNFLINSKYSSVDRRKLTDDYDKKSEIVEYINHRLIKLLNQLTTQHMQESLANELRIEISNIFHKCLILDEGFVLLCYTNRISNRYLLKYNAEDICISQKYIVYQREKVELYEKKLIGQKWTVNESKQFVYGEIFGTDTIEYNENLFLDIVCETYKMAFENQNNMKLRTVLNAIGTIPELITFRILNTQYSRQLYDKDIDRWLSAIAPECQKIALSLIGRYKLHPGVSANGEITSSSFYEYLFSEDNNGNGLFAKKQQQDYSDKYQNLKKELYKLLVNREQEGKASLWNCRFCNYSKGEVPFFASWDSRAGYDVYYDNSNWTVYDYHELPSNTKTFGNDLFELLIERFILEPNMCTHIKKFNGKMMLTDNTFPEWGYPVTNYDHRYILSTAKWFKSKVINLNFMTKITVDSIKQLKDYLLYFIKNKDSWKGFNFDVSASLNYKENSIQELMDLYYRFDVLQYENLLFSEIALTMNYENQEISGNLCPHDYCEFIGELEDLDVTLAQVANIRAEGKEVIYLYKDAIKIYYRNEWRTIGSVNNNTSNKVLIITNERLAWKEAVCMVLKDICQEDDIIEKCEAYLPQNQEMTVLGDEYIEIQDSFYEGNIRSRNATMFGKAHELSVKQLKYVITARGNNNKKCGCCGQFMNNQNLVIVSNSSIDNKSKFRQIINVICDDCNSLLKKSHQYSQIIYNSQNNEYYVEHICLVQNSHQQKEIKLKYRVCNGILSLWGNA